MKDQILSQLNEELHRALAQVTSLQAQIAARTEFLSGDVPFEASPQMGKVARQVAATAERRAPVGVLEKAITDILKIGKSEAVTKQQVVKKLKTNGYEFLLRPAHIAKTLAKMKKKGKVSVRQEGFANVYSLAS